MPAVAGAKANQQTTVPYLASNSNLELLARFAAFAPLGSKSWCRLRPAGAEQQSTGLLHLIIQICPPTYIKRPKPNGFGLFMELLARFELATSSLPRIQGLRP